MHDAKFYQTLDSDRIQCNLCPRYCKLKPGQHGFCYVRKNTKGKLVTLAYGKPYAVNVDPIEKKPLFHFLPGSRILSIGTAGCNMACKHCQNWDISTAKFEQSRTIDMPPAQVAQVASHYQAESIAYTYNEPTVFAEYAMDTAELAARQNLKNVMVTNGYITPEALEQVYQHIDGANVDLKGFSESFYRKITLSHLAPVLETLKTLKEFGVWIEVTNLIIPGHNDNPGEIKSMCEWIGSELGDDVPVHFTAFHGSHKMIGLPSTLPKTLLDARQLAMDVGLQYVYVGNIINENASSTHCPNCKSMLIRRNVYYTKIEKLDGDHCSKCNYRIPGIFN